MAFYSPAIIKRGRRHLAAQGFALIEVIVFIVLVSIAVGGVLSVFARTGAQSAQVMLERQAQQIAKSVLAEVKAMPYTPADTSMGREGAESRQGPTFFNSVNDYDGFVMGQLPPGIFLKGVITPLAGLDNYEVRVTVAQPAAGGNWNGLPVADVAFITVRVSTPRLLAPVVLEGVRTRYATASPPL